MAINPDALASRRCTPPAASCPLRLGSAARSPEWRWVVTPEVMMSASDGCPKCGAELVRGFVVDHNMGAATVGMWVEGEPIHAHWGGGVKVPREHSIPVATFRCVGCGFLQSYARPEFAEKR
jgi:hypothetical protein